MINPATASVTNPQRDAITRLIADHPDAGLAPGDPGHGTVWVVWLETGESAGKVAALVHPDGEFTTHADGTTGTETPPAWDRAMPPLLERLGEPLAPLLRAAYAEWLHGCDARELMRQLGRVRDHRSDELRLAYAGGLTMRSLAAATGLSHQRIAQIIAGT